MDFGATYFRTGNRRQGVAGIDNPAAEDGHAIAWLNSIDEAPRNIGAVHLHAQQAQRKNEAPIVRIILIHGPLVGGARWCFVSCRQQEIELGRIADRPIHGQTEFKVPRCVVNRIVKRMGKRKIAAHDPRIHGPAGCRNNIVVVFGAGCKRLNPFGGLKEGKRIVSEDAGTGDGTGKQRV